MKNIIFIILSLIFHSCNSQFLNTTTDSINFYNPERYKNWQSDPEYCRQSNPCSKNDSHYYLMKGNERIRVWEHEGTIHVEKSNKITPYTYFYAYDIKDNLLIGYYSNFYRAICGLDRDYDKKGKIIKETDWDKPYKFSIEDMVKKFREEYHVDILNRQNVHRFYRYENSVLKIPIYKIYLNTEIGNKWIGYLVDGNSGKTLYTMKISEGDITDIFEEYLKSIGKFKGPSSKYDPSTD